MNHPSALVNNDEYWLNAALELADHAAAHGEIPVGAVLVRQGVLIGVGWNQPIALHDPTAHAEIQALRAAGHSVGNYRLPGAELFVTLEPCLMCAGAIIQARLARVIYGAADPKAGACGSVFDVLPSDRRFNHHTACQQAAPAIAARCGEVLRQFFRMRRGQLAGNTKQNHQ